MRCSHKQYASLTNNVSCIAIESRLIRREIRNHATVLIFLGVAEADGSRDLVLHCVIKTLKGIDHEGRPLTVARNHKLGCRAL